MTEAQEWVLSQIGHGRADVSFLCARQCDVPDMLSMSMCAAFNGKDGDSLGFEGASERARELAAAACHGADAPLAWPLPHTRIMQSQKRGKPLINCMHANKAPCIISGMQPWESLGIWYSVPRILKGCRQKWGTHILACAD